jgi:hypothetical protein
VEESRSHAMALRADRRLLVQSREIESRKCASSGRAADYRLLLNAVDGRGFDNGGSDRMGRFVEA